MKQNGVTRMERSHSTSHFIQLLDKEVLSVLFCTCFELLFFFFFRNINYFIAIYGIIDYYKIDD